MNSTGNTIQKLSRVIEKNSPRLVPKKFWNTAPVYPSKAEISSFNNIRIRDRSIGLKTVANSANLSSG